MDESIVAVVVLERTKKSTLQTAVVVVQSRVGYYGRRNTRIAYANCEAMDLQSTRMLVG